MITIPQNYIFLDKVGVNSVIRERIRYIDLFKSPFGRVYAICLSGLSIINAYLLSGNEFIQARDPYF